MIFHMMTKRKDDQVSLCTYQILANLSKLRLPAKVFLIADPLWQTKRDAYLTKTHEDGDVKLVKSAIETWIGDWEKAVDIYY